MSACINLLIAYTKGSEFVLIPELPNYLNNLSARIVSCEELVE